MLATRYRIGKPIKERYHTYYTPVPKLTKFRVPIPHHRRRLQFWTHSREKWISLRKVFPQTYTVTDYYPKRVRIRRRNQSWVIYVLRLITRFPFKFKIKTRVKAVFYTTIALTMYIKYSSILYDLWAEPLTNYI